MDQEVLLRGARVDRCGAQSVQRGAKALEDPDRRGLRLDDRRPQLPAEEEHSGEHGECADAYALSTLGCQLVLGVGHVRGSLFRRGEVGFPHGGLRRTLW